MNPNFFYQPEAQFCADFIPYYENGVYHLFYLRDFRGDSAYGEGIPWYQVETKDFVHFEDQGEMLPKGTSEEQDLYVFTGSVIKAKGQYHIFYTGHNPHFGEKGLPVQGILHAVSDDLHHWVKRKEWVMYANPQYYEKDDFRDPFVYFSPETGCYHMLLVCRKKGGAISDGFTALYSSKDLEHWTDQGALWDPGLYHTHECPDLFQMGDWWYLIYSEYTDRWVTHYVMAKDLKGPWHIPEDDQFDGRAFYAAKSASDGENRYLFGWITTRQEGKDQGNWMWGGCLGVHRLVQRSDGTLACQMPDSVRKAFEEKQRLTAPLSLCREGGKIRKPLFTAPMLPCMLSATVTFASGTQRFGVTLYHDVVADKGYQFVFYPSQNKVEFAGITAPIRNDGLFRPLSLQPDTPISIQLIQDGEVCLLYVDGETALSCRMCEPMGHDFSFFAVDGSVTITEAQLSVKD